MDAAAQKPTTILKKGLRGGGDEQEWDFKARWLRAAKWGRVWM
jgi:hypothetical protein